MNNGYDNNGSLFDNILYRMIYHDGDRMLENIKYTLQKYNVGEFMDPENENNLLVLAVRCGNITLVNYLVSIGLTIPDGLYCADISGNTIFHQAVSHRKDFPELYNSIVLGCSYVITDINQDSGTVLSVLIKDCNLQELKDFIKVVASPHKLRKTNESVIDKNSTVSVYMEDIKDTRPVRILCNSHICYNYSCGMNISETNSMECIITDNDMFIAFTFQENIDVLEYIIKMKIITIMTCQSILDAVRIIINTRGELEAPLNNMLGRYIMDS